jgi:uncharacterized protein (TIGR01777 family)
MQVFVTGGTGFVGRALGQRLLRDGHGVAVWTRSPETAESHVGPGIEAVDARGGDEALRVALTRADAVVNLAGANLFEGRWTAHRKRALIDSRVGLTRRLVHAMAVVERRPTVLVSASAVGYYGDRGGEVLDEASAPADDFLARLCRDWEDAARRAEDLGLRVVRLRMGLVFGPEGGALARMLPPFRVGLGGRLGSGRQWVSWIHLLDLVEIIATALTDGRFVGPFNAVAPTPVTNRELTAVLARTVGRPARLFVPATALRLAFGEAAGVLLGGQRVVPARLAAMEWSFRYPRLEGALAAILRPERETEIRRHPDPPPDLDGPKPQYRLLHRTRIPAPLDDVFAFFSDAANLAVLTPPWTDLRFLTAPPHATHEGLVIDYRLRLGPFPMRWRTVIRTWDPPRRMVDVQTRGPYRLWWHEHRFEADGDGTRMEDRVWYRLPFGPLGRLAHRLVVGRLLRRIFGYRACAIDLRFGRREA